MKRLLKYTLFALTGFFALLGVGICALLLYLCLMLFPRECEERLLPHAHFGKEYPYSLAADCLPIPEQTNSPFPMVVDCPASDGRSHILVFRASEAWQAAFRALYTDSSVNPMLDVLGTVQHHAIKLNDHRLYDFIAGRPWEPFHAAFIYKATHSLYFYALRDASGEHLLVYLIKD